MTRKHIAVIFLFVSVTLAFYSVVYFADSRWGRSNTAAGKADITGKLPAGKEPAAGDKASKNEPVITEVPDKKLLVINGDKLYYTSIVGKTMALRLGKYLAEEELFADDDKSIKTKIDKKNNKYIFSIAVAKSAVNDKNIEEYAQYMSQALYADVFETLSRVEIHLCDEDFNTLKIVNKVE